MNIKQIIRDTAYALGFQRAVIASLKPMEAERKFFEEWLSCGYAGNMDYLKRNPHRRTSPQLLYPEAYCAIVLSASYYTKAPPDPGLQFGKVASYAVGLDYHDVIPYKLKQMKLVLEAKIGRPLLGKYFTDDVALFEQAFARRSGLGFTGKNSLIIGPKLMGSYHFIAEFFTDLPLEPDEPYHGTCGKCFRCGNACPTKAIVSDGIVDSRLCISYLTIENKGTIPLELRSKIGEWVFGCDICQDICPYNQSPCETVWHEFQPGSGAGHYLNLFDLLEIKDKQDFLARFGKTPLHRPKRKGLLRNALVVIGNRRPENAISRLQTFIENESELLLKEHAFWAIAQYKDDGALQALKKLYASEQNTGCKLQIQQHIESIH